MVSSAIYVWTTYMLIFRTDAVLNLILKNDSFEPSEFSRLQIHRSAILSICVIVTGGLLVIDSIPSLAFQFWAVYHSKSLFFYSENFGYNGVLIAGTRFFLGILMMYYQKIIVLWIDKRRRS
jgi:hypothetical protein